MDLHTRAPSLRYCDSPCCRHGPQRRLRGCWSVCCSRMTCAKLACSSMLVLQKSQETTAETS